MMRSFLPDRMLDRLRIHKSLILLRFGTIGTLERSPAPSHARARRCDRACAHEIYRSNSSNRSFLPMLHPSAILMRWRGGTLWVSDPERVMRTVSVLQWDASKAVHGCTCAHGTTHGKKRAGGVAQGRGPADAGRRHPEAVNLVAPSDASRGASLLRAEDRSKCLNP